MDRLVADWKLFRSTVHDVKIISPRERRCDCDHSAHLCVRGCAHSLQLITCPLGCLVCQDNCITVLLVLRPLFHAITFHLDVFLRFWCCALVHLCDLIQYKWAWTFFPIYLLIGLNDPINESISFKTRDTHEYTPAGFFSRLPSIRLSHSLCDSSAHTCGVVNEITQHSIECITYHMNAAPRCGWTISMEPIKASTVHHS